MNRYPLWQYVLLLVILLLGILYALPNLYGQQPAVQISGAGGKPVGTALIPRVKNVLQSKNISFAGVTSKEDSLMVRFTQNKTQLLAADALDKALGDNYVTAPALAPQTPEWLLSIGAQPMALGLDLRGGVHFLIQVDMDTVFKKAYERYSRNLASLLRKQSIRYSRIWPRDQSVKLKFPSQKARESALSVLSEEFNTLQFEPVPDSDNAIKATLTKKEHKRLTDFAVENNISTLRKRVNELGVSESVVKRQGQARIVVELPGVQDTAEAKRLLGKTATLQYRLVAQGYNASKVAKTGNVPAGTDLFYTDDGRPILLKEEIIASGAQIVDASAGRDPKTSQPTVDVTLGGEAADSMYETTSKHVGDPMAVLFIETKIETRYVDGEKVFDRNTTKKVISVASINGVFGKRFQTTGLTASEAHDLALLLRAGALAAPVRIISERTIGPSLGAENIQKGKIAVLVGFLLVVAFMAIYYRGFGLIADAALMANLVLITAVMSLFQATLTLPGIAGIVLTLGMAVDANVIIFERIREELVAGNSPQSAISRGYDRAFSAIADGQLTTLVAAIVLFAFGTGPIKGFAVTLTIGIVTSLYTSIVGSRAIVNLLYGRKKRLQSLSIG